jgi:hypothetical protein
MFQLNIYYYIAAGAILFIIGGFIWANQKPSVGA